MSLLGTSGYRRDRASGQRERAGSARRDGRGRPRDRRVPAVALALIVALTSVLFGGACGSKKSEAAPPPAQPTVDFTLIESPSLQFLPRHQEVEGWQLEEDPVVVPGDAIGNYLGAVASSLARYELVDLTAGKYVTSPAGGFATVEIFRFPDFVKAFGAYSLRKDAARSYVAIENEAYVSKFAVHVWRGPFYVRVTGGAPNALESLTRLASAVASRMPAAPSKPAVFNFFPTDTRVEHSERFSAERGFSQTMLANSFQASFNVGGDIMEGLIIPSANKESAAKILDAYRELYVRNGKLLDPIPNLGEDNFTGEDRYLGRAVAFRLDRFVVAFNGFKERQKLVELAIATDARILGSIRKQLVAADKQAAAAQRPAATTTDRNSPPWQRAPQ